MMRFASADRGRVLSAACQSGARPSGVGPSRAWLFAACLCVAGCGARSTLEGAETSGQGGSTSAVTSTETTTSTTLTTSTTSTTMVSVSGCSDGAREGFTDFEKYPYIAGCSGGFQIPGVLGELTAPACGWKAGNGSSNPNGIGCNAWDLCAPGWHVCGGAAEVAQDSPTGCDGVAPAQDPVFFITRQSGTGCGTCATGSDTSSACATCSCAGGCAQTEKTSNDVFGCGTIGEPPSDCGVLNSFSNDVCTALGYPWLCGSDSCGEAHNVWKETATNGGVLCCADMLD
ncbi:MAG: hypothetical protein U0441_39125 [Polyangiaceae bacterium]